MVILLAASAKVTSIRASIAIAAAWETLSESEISVAWTLTDASSVVKIESRRAGCAIVFECRHTSCAVTQTVNRGKVRCLGLYKIKGRIAERLDFYAKVSTVGVRVFYRAKIELVKHVFRSDD